MFKPFSRIAANKALNPNGNGLGLHICKLICMSLGGKIEVKSDVGAFTTFTFWMAVKNPGEGETSVVQTARSAGKLQAHQAQELITKETIDMQ